MIIDGVVQAYQGNGFLVSKNTYTDFEIKAEFWVDTKASSVTSFVASTPTRPPPTPMR